MLEGAGACEIEYHYYAESFTVVGGCDGSESFLACCVPDLCFDDHFVNYECFDCKLDTDGGLGVISKGILREFCKNVGLADSRVPNDDDLEHEIRFDVSCHAAIITE